MLSHEQNIPCTSLEIFPLSLMTKVKQKRLTYPFNLHLLNKYSPMPYVDLIIVCNTNGRTYGPGNKQMQLLLIF